MARLRPSLYTHSSYIVEIFDKCSSTFTRVFALNTWSRWIPIQRITRRGDVYIFPNFNFRQTFRLCVHERCGVGERAGTFRGVVIDLPVSIRPFVVPPQQTSPANTTHYAHLDDTVCQCCLNMATFSLPARHKVLPHTFCGQPNGILNIDWVVPISVPSSTLKSRHRPLVNVVGSDLKVRRSIT